MNPTPQDLSNDTTFSQIKSRVPVPLSTYKIFLVKVMGELCRRQDPNQDWPPSCQAIAAQFNLMPNKDDVFFQSSNTGPDPAC